MNQYWALFCLLLLAAAGFGGERYGENRITVKCDKHDEAQQQVTITAQQHVIGEVKTQETINQGAENAFQKNVDTIGALYDSGVPSNPAATGPGMCAIPAAASRPQTSRKYKLTLKQCDVEEAKFNALWNDWLAQAAVK